jgi:hypothetical protein
MAHVRKHYKKKLSPMVNPLYTIHNAEENNIFNFVLDQKRKEKPQGLFLEAIKLFHKGNLVII